MTTEELIRQAFADVPYPGDDAINHHFDCPECEELRDYLRGKNWRDLKFPGLRGQLLTLLEPAAYHYFLPGYMLATLKNWDDADMIPYSIITLGGYPEDEAKVKERARRRRQLFTRSQREAVAAYLVELGKNGPSEWRDDTNIAYAVDQILQD